MILCANPRAQYLAQREEIDAAIRRVLEGGRYILGEEAAAFEREFAAYAGASHGIGVGNGTDALEIALAACGIGPGDEVITVAHTAVATVAAIERVGASPVLVDIDPATYTLDPAQLERAHSPRVKAVVPVHLYGQCADLPPIVEFARAHGLRIIEDCAQAHGASYQGRPAGSWGDAACFSFYPTKNLGALGDGGMVVTSDAGIAARARLLREYGWSRRYVSDVAGRNSRLDELQSAVLRVKLRSLDQDNARRAQLAGAYTAALAESDLELPRARAEAVHVFHLYVVRSRRRDALQRHLDAGGVGALAHYPVPIHLQPAYEGRLRGARALPETEKAAREVLSLPMHPQLTEAELGVVTGRVRTFSGERS
jgi:dTDP-4-amino-4,6-dideoxygalactose transaminase